MLKVKLYQNLLTKAKWNDFIKKLIKFIVYNNQMLVISMVIIIIRLFYTDDDFMKEVQVFLLSVFFNFIILPVYTAVVNYYLFCRNKTYIYKILFFALMMIVLNFELDIIFMINRLFFPPSSGYNIVIITVPQMYIFINAIYLTSWSVAWCIEFLIRRK